MSQIDNNSGGKVDINTVVERSLVLQNQLIGHIQRESRRRFILMLILFVPSFVFLLLSLLIDYIRDFDSFENGYVAVVSIDGVIMANQPASASRLYTPLREAFENEDAKGVILRISSPGGSPTQAYLIRDYVKSLRDEFPEKRLIVVGEEALASASYWIATGADKIYVQPTTLTGSIGVIMESYDFHGLAQELKIGKHTLTAGEHKRRLDPFEKPSVEDLQKMQGILDDMHQIFIADVKGSRKARLSTSPSIFTGDIWLGEEAVELGLADGLKTFQSALQDDFKTTEFKEYIVQKKFSEMLGLSSGGAAQVMVEVIDNLSAARDYSMR